MADNKTRHEPGDLDRININDAYELDYWTESLAVTSDRLKELVAKHGPLLADVRAALKKREAGKTKSRSGSTGWRPHTSVSA